jgi:16S rRNA (uracil1498-N3)-methyltransferase
MVSSIRLFLDAPLHPGAQPAGSPAQAHYLASVMRARAGGVVLLFNGREGEFAARITLLHRGEVRFAVETATRPQAAEPDLWLAFALLKRDATDLLVQKATELGVAALLPLRSARTQAERLNPARLAAIATEAAEHAEGLRRPALHPWLGLDALLAGGRAGRRLIGAAERSAAPPPPAGLPAGLLIGPEGGFAPAELDVLRARPFVTFASFGPRILRAETAAIVGLALLQAPAFS